MHHFSLIFDTFVYEIYASHLSCSTFLFSFKLHRHLNGIDDFWRKILNCKSCAYVSQGSTHIVNEKWHWIYNNGRIQQSSHTLTASYLKSKFCFKSDEVNIKTAMNKISINILSTRPKKCIMTCFNCLQKSIEYLSWVQ